MSRDVLVSEIAQILEPWAWETKSYNATVARDDATSKAMQIVELLANRPADGGATREQRASRIKNNQFGVWWNGMTNHQRRFATVEDAFLAGATAALPLQPEGVKRP